MHLPDGFSYFTSFLTPAEQEVLLGHVRALRFVREAIRGRVLSRGYAQFGVAYKTQGRDVIPGPAFPGFLTSLVEQARGYCPLHALFDACIATYYRAQLGAGIGWHTDARCFGDVIIAVSLGGTARLQFRPNGEKRHTHELAVAPGSLYVMAGPARWKYQHRVLPLKTDRYSLTFRQVLALEGE